MPLTTRDLMTRMPVAIAQDTFIRANQSGLGSSWTRITGNSTLAILNNQGTLTGGANATNLIYFGTGTATDGEALLSFTEGASTDNAGTVMRGNTAGSTYYQARYQSGTGLVIRKTISGSGTSLIASTAFSTSAGTRYWIRFRIVGSLLLARVWVASGAEPATWMVVARDTDITGAGRYGLIVQPNPNTDTLAIDHFAFFDVSGSPSSDITSRTRLLATRSTPTTIGARLALLAQRGGDLGLRFSLTSLVGRIQDLSGRLRLQAGESLSLLTRLSLVSLAREQIGTRLALLSTPLQLVGIRLRMRALQTRDLGMRLPLLDQVARSLTTRVTLFGQRLGQIGIRVPFQAQRGQSLGTRTTLASAALSLVLALRLGLSSPHTGAWLKARLVLHADQQRDLPLTLLLQGMRFPAYILRTILLGGQAAPLPLRLRIAAPAQVQGMPARALLRGIPNQTGIVCRFVLSPYYDQDMLLFPQAAHL